MIGYYDYTVILTYGGLICAILGILQAFHGNFVGALLLLGGALFCDTMDGRVARAKKDRTHEESLFGMQIDSLCDAVSFGVFPGLMCYFAGLRDWFSLVIICYYCLCGVIRLGYFNVMELVKEPDTKPGYFGLPIPCLAVVLPAAFLLGQFLPTNLFHWLLRGLLVIFGTLYIANFRINKPGMKFLLGLCVVFWVPMIALCFLA